MVAFNSEFWVVSCSTLEVRADNWLVKFLQNAGAGAVRRCKVGKSFSGGCHGGFGGCVVAGLVGCRGFFVAFFLGLEKVRFEIGPRFVCIGFLRHSRTSSW
jgi:hypothetical protein